MKVRATVLYLVGDPPIYPTEDPRSVFFGYLDAAASIGPFHHEEFDCAIHLERQGASHLGAKGQASALFDLLAVNTDWGLELLYHDGGEDPDRVRPRPSS